MTLVDSESDASANSRNHDELTFYHFNDVYHVNQPTVLARFAHDFRNAADCLKVFSGDAFGPSLESSVLKGEHIVPVLNHLSIDVACYGNHDFDFGAEKLTELSTKCNFPWLLSNAFTSDGRLLSSAREYVVRQYKGYKIGFFGLAGTDWPSNCQHLPRESVIADPAETAKRVSLILREKECVDLVIAVTHMRLEEDIQVSDACRAEVDFIMGGHDHDIMICGDQVTVVNDDARGAIRIVKSGTDFRSYSIIRLLVSRVKGQAKVHEARVHHKRDLSLPKKYPEDSEIRGILSSVQDRVASVSGSRLFRTASALDGRTSVIRNAETNLGNLLADTVRAYYGTDIAFVNSGSIRCDRIIPEGELTVRDVIDIVPFDNAFVVKRLSGRVLLRALENSVSDSRTDGRFLQLSGLSILVDLRRSEGGRIMRAMLDSGEQIRANDQTMYTVAMVSFIADGFDGYVDFKQMETLVDVEGAMTDTSLMLQVLRGNGGDLDNTEVMVERARKTVVVAEEDGLPLVDPKIENRITFAGVL
ncbi:Metallo-dependent phosphatase [Leucogyrophana mollusca]|uniref:Metallo-dependent phosphatase n=1 Tax=Leucogyrophana mollusca TaxID=85980 RepID=A0ACB8BZ39_9AGAM|nr:Metallo-dependent phosphatase [Leucogyrophana mollusca]